MNRAIPLGLLKKRFALGNDRFKSEIERLTGRRLTIGKPGPKSLEEKVAAMCGV